MEEGEHTVAEHKGAHLDHGEIEQAEVQEYGEGAPPLDAPEEEGGEVTEATEEGAGEAGVEGEQEAAGEEQGEAVADESAEGAENTEYAENGEAGEAVEGEGEAAETVEGGEEVAEGEAGEGGETYEETAEGGENAEEGAAEGEEGEEAGRSKEDLEKEELTKAIFGDSEEEDNFEVPEPQEDNAAEGEEEDYIEESTKKLKRLVKQRNRKRDSDEEEQQPADEEETEAKPKKKRRLSKKKRNAIDEGEGEGGEAGGEEAEGEKKKKKKKKSKKQKPAEEGVEGGEGGEQAEPPADDGNDSDGPIRRRKQPEGDMPEFDAAMARLRHKRPKKDLNEEEARVMNEAVDDFIVKMEAAAELDADANRSNQPATHKVAILPKVSEMLNKTRFSSMFVNKGGLTAVRKWLEPLPDRSLPSLNIREQLLDILFKIPFDTDQLKESEVGKVVMFLWKAEKETLKNKRICAKIIEKWSRPIFGLGTGYHSRQDEEELDRPSRRPKKEEEESEIDRRTREQMKDNRKFHARIPQRLFMDFKKMPTNNDAPKAAPTTMRNPHVAAAEADRILKKKRKGKTPTAGGRVLRAEKISVEGRMTK